MCWKQWARKLKLKINAKAAANRAPMSQFRARTEGVREIGGALIPRLIDELPGFGFGGDAMRRRNVIADAQEMRVKESDRIAVIARELRKLGAQIEERPDGMVITGRRKLIGAKWKARAATIASR